MANEIKCPKCGSTQLSANKKGFSTGKALTGAVLTGGAGLLAGGIGANKILITCLSCGKEFYPGQDLEAMNKKKKAEAEAVKSPLFWVFMAIVVLLFFWLFHGCL